MKRFNIEELESMTKEEKYRRTSYEEFKARNNIIQTLYTDMDEMIAYLTQNEYPYLEYEYNGKLHTVLDHKVLWYHGYWGQDDADYWVWKTKLPQQGYIWFENPKEKKSVPDRPHIHLLLLQE